ncbi:GTPase IMAP family member 8-like [Toxotes jaculatrix]|uniref:GTPase IMAP family member 8-like n=1 Tax=Toxotes jaculatrix TaxID=941984 RepID=UPI001B3B0633|nr:GTPase IMAP family member 8-like [Toxotes jaculatrix]
MANIYGASKSGQHHQSPQLRIVLIGGRELRGKPSNKSATGNIILGKNVFDTSRRTAQSAVGQQEVHGRQVTVVDSPGWWWHYPLENTPKLDQIEIMNSVYLCSPGPHAFLLVIPVGLPFPRIFKLSLQEHLELFQKRVFNRTIVLFTVHTPCSDITLKDKISKYPALKFIVEQCGNRKHVLNISDVHDSAQVIELFKKIEAMVAENGGGHCSIDSAPGKALREKMQVIAERASKRAGFVQAQRRKLQTVIEGGNPPPTHLRVVMVGAQWSAKSSTGNTILGKYAFAVHPRGTTTKCCEISHSMVAERRLTMVDSPGWFYNHTLQDTCEMDKLEIENSMYLCPPGPHAVLLVVGLASAFNEAYQRAVQEHMSLFTDDIWNHTIVVFTRGEWLGQRTVEERIESENGLQWLMEKCGNRYHVLNNMNHTNKTQVTELLKKIEEMWAGNKDPHYEVDVGHAQQMEPRKEAGEKMAKRIRQLTERQTRVLRELFKGERQQITDLRVVLIGKKESGKSMAGNRILMNEIFNTTLMKKEFKETRGTMVCVKHKRNVSGVNITVVETPGWPTGPVTPSWVKSEVLHSVSMCAPGPHIFLLVIPISKAFTENDRKAVVELLMPFGENVWRHCMVLFTWGDWLSNRPIEEHIAIEGKALQWLVEKCGNRYHVISLYDGISIMGLFQKMTDMTTRNKGHCFTTEDKQGKKLKLPWQAKQLVLTEQEWNRREQELIERMLKALAQEPEEPTLPIVKTTASFDGAYIPSMSADAPSEFGSTLWSQRDYAFVSQWLNTRAGSSDVTSGFGSMSASASYVEKLDESSLTYEHQQPMSWLFPDTVKIQRRHSF